MSDSEKNTPSLKLKDRKERDILRAAGEEFRARGFVATSMDAIAARARVSKRTVYNHFPSKAELFQAIINELFEHAQAAITRPYDAETPLKTQLLEIAEQEITLLLSEEFIDLVRTTIAECMRSPELGRETLERMQSSESALLSWVKAAAADGRLTVGDAALAAGQFVALIKSDILWPQLFAGQGPPSRHECQRIADAAVAMFLDHYESS